MIKLDRSFISDIARDNNVQIILATIIGMARRLGLSVVAEGVEERAQLQQLQHIDCGAVQGYYFSRPLERDALTAFAQNWTTPLGAQAGAAHAAPWKWHPHAVRFAI